jgi:6-pyruvoyltetrahydropterin/6-carboxytetrahydropterin synthase
MILECKLTFEAAHRNTSVHADERTRRLHGHSYEVTVAVEGAIDPKIGWVMDFAEVKDRASEVIDRLDHYKLNDIPGIHDSTRADVETWIASKLRSILPPFAYCRLHIVGERGWTPSVSRIAPGIEQVKFGFDAAHFLPTLPDTHKCRRIHGHSFRIAVTSTDVSRLAEPLRDIHGRLDHRLLNEISGLENPTSEYLAEWLSSELKSRKCAYQEIMVAETCTSCCRLKSD